MSLRFTPAGDFSLAASVGFQMGFTPASYLRNGGGTAGQRPDQEPVLRLALGVEGQPISLGADIRQSPSGVVTAELVDVAGGQKSELDHDRLGQQIARILSLDVDATGLRSALEGDPHATALAQRVQGLRPVCFNSPYESAAWSILSQRVQMTQAARMRLRIAEELGTRHTVAGHPVVAFPRPEVLLAAGRLGELVPSVKAGRLHAIARAALDGVLDGARLRALTTDDALRLLTTIDGVGPFSAELILVRGAGHPDVFPRNEKRLHREMAAVYGVPVDDLDALERVAAGWAPFRSWVSFFYRSQAGR